MLRPLHDLFCHKVLESGHLDSLLRNLGGQVRGYHEHALAVPDDHVTGEHGYVSATDRNVYIQGLMKCEVRRRAGTALQA